jgi:uncharacterized protein YggE
MYYWYKGNEVATSKKYELLVRNAATAGKAIQALKAINVANVSLEKIDHSEMDKFRREVQVEAVKVAKSKASDLLSSIGQKVGRALWIQEIEQPVYASYAMNSRSQARSTGMSKSAYESEDAELDFKTIKLTSIVSAKFAIE